MNEIWDLIKNSYLVNPRDVLTYGGRKYFYVYTQDDKVYLESGRNHPNGSFNSVYWFGIFRDLKL